jgi:sugar phosphate isomerase/epimerase
MISGMLSLSRRRFLRQAGLAATGAAIASGLPTRSWATSAGRVPGIQLYMVNDDLTKDPAGTLAKVAAAGYKEVESAGFASLTAAQFRKLVDDAGLHCPSAHLYFGMQETGKLLEDANALGVQYVVSSILPPHPPATSDVATIIQLMNNLTLDTFKHMAELANQIGGQAKQAGLQYAYHNHNIEFRDYGGQTGYDILLRETDPNLVKFEADCGWMVTAGVNPVDFLHRYPGRYRMIHVKDFTASTKTSTTLGLGDAQAATELGRGHIDYKPILAAAKKAGVEHYFIEQDPPILGMTPLEAAKIDCDSLRKLWAAG